MKNRHLPQALESPRLLIRVAAPGDGRVLNQAVAESLSELEPWLPWLHPVPTVEQSEITCRAAYARYLLDEDLMVLLFQRDTGDLVGCSGLHSIDWALCQFEIGYWARTRYSGHGYVTEAVRALADFALSRLAATRVYLRMDARNGRSARVAELAGFEWEGTIRNEQRDVSGELRDTKIYSRIPDRRSSHPA